MQLMHSSPGTNVLPNAGHEVLALFVQGCCQRERRHQRVGLRGPAVLHRGARFHAVPTWRAAARREWCDVKLAVYALQRAMLMQVSMDPSDM